MNVYIYIFIYQDDPVLSGRSAVACRTQTRMRISVCANMFVEDEHECDHLDEHIAEHRVEHEHAMTLGMPYPTQVTPHLVLVFCMLRI